MFHDGSLTIKPFIFRVFMVRVRAWVFFRGPLIRKRFRLLNIFLLLPILSIKGVHDLYFELFRLHWGPGLLAPYSLQELFLLLAVYLLLVERLELGNAQVDVWLGQVYYVLFILDVIVQLVANLLGFEELVLKLETLIIIICGSYIVVSIGFLVKVFSEQSKDVIGLLRLVLYHLPLLIIVYGKVYFYPAQNGELHRFLEETLLPFVVCDLYLMVLDK